MAHRLFYSKKLYPIQSSRYSLMRQERQLQSIVSQAEEWLKQEGELRGLAGLALSRPVNARARLPQVAAQDQSC